jgi:hypothetical protein
MVVGQPDGRRSHELTPPCRIAPGHATDGGMAVPHPNISDDRRAIRPLDEAAINRIAAGRWWSARPPP